MSGETCELMVAKNIPITTELQHGLSANPRVTARVLMLCSLWLKRSKRQPHAIQPVSDGTEAPNENAQEKAQENAKENAKEQYIIEVSTEVCNKVGGIYTVLRTKAATFKQHYGNRYILIGPIVPSEDYSKELDESHINAPDVLRRTVQLLKSIGATVKWGRWKIEGRPWTVLLGLGDYVDPGKHLLIKNSIEEYWELKFTKNRDALADAKEASYMHFGYLVARFVHEFQKNVADDFDTVCLFHEWMASLAMVFLELMRVRVATIFITHATVLGRRLCEEKPHFHEAMATVEPEKEAERLDVLHLHLIENRAILTADVVATVSKTTADEVKSLHGREIDVIVANGLSMAKQTRDKHEENRPRIDDFVRKHFFQNVNFNAGKIFYFLSAGRYEFKNKGIDLFIESLAKLNNRLVGERSDITVVSFLIFPAKTYDINDATLKRHANYKHRRRVVRQVTKTDDDEFLDDVMYNDYYSEKLENIKLIREQKVQLREVIEMTRYGREETPPLTTHNMRDENDVILLELRNRELINRYHDRVKFVFHPEFIKRENPLFGLDYLDFVAACHLGVFASGYEPFGYTPLECLMLGTPAVTSDLAGYGNFLAERVYPTLDGDPIEYGSYLVNRERKSLDESAAQLADYLYAFIHQSPEKRKWQRENAVKIARCSSWDEMAKCYYDAINLAVARKYK